MSRTVHAYDERNGYTTPEKRLGMAIILNAIAEAMGHGAGNDSPSRRDDARDTALQWFSDADEDFEAICDMADLNPKAVQTAAMAYISDGRRLPNRAPTRRVPRPKVGLDIQMIAQVAGVSLSSVRNVISGNASVSMTNRVQAAIHSLKEPANDR